MDLVKLRGLMEAESLDGLLIMPPSRNLYFATGTQTPGVIAVFTKSDEAVVICNDWAVDVVRQETGINDIRTYETWIHTERWGDEPREPGKPGSKPEQFDPLTVLAEAVKDKGLAKGRIGVELETMPAQAHRRLITAVPDAELVDVSSPPKSSKTMWWRMRMIKTRDEVDRFRRATEIAEEGVKAAAEAASEALERKVTELDVQKAFIKAVLDHGGLPRRGVGLGPWGAGVRSASPHLYSSPYALREGDVLRFECGAIYRGCSSDICRNFVVGKPTEHALKLHKAIQTAQQKVKEAMKPGVRLSQLFEIGQSTVRRMGFPQYTRGHVGHSIGVGAAGEEPPFISAQETLTLQPNMVLCVEIPYYVLGAHGMNVEDDVVVTEDGIESFSKLPRELISLPQKR